MTRGAVLLLSLLVLAACARDGTRGFYVGGAAGPTRPAD